MNNKPCISLDVSQGKSHIQGFYALGKSVRKPQVILHTKNGFQKIIDLFNTLFTKTNQDPLIIFEFTGIYHQPLEMFLLSQKLKYHIVSPLRAAKFRKKEIRSVKTDKYDCLTLANMFYKKEIGDFNLESKEHKELRSINRFYENILLRQQELKVNFRECLAIIYPNYKITASKGIGAFKNVYTNESLCFLKEFPHPQLVCQSDVLTISNKLKDWVGLSHKNMCNEIAKRLYDYASNIVSGCYLNSPEVDKLKFYLDQIQNYEVILKNTLNQLQTLLDGNLLYNTILTIPCIKENLASRFVAELGDISRFKSYKQIIAYSGTDPIVYQSGDKSGLHLSISKKGNKHLRTILYLMVNQLIKASYVPSSIKDYYKKKTQQGSPKLVASVACCNKLVRIIYYLNKTGAAYE